MSIYVLAVLIGVVCGLRAMAGPAVISWCAYLGIVPVQGTWLAFLGYAYTPYIVTLLALGELITDQLPSTPSRKVPMQFGGRIVAGAVCGAALTAQVSLVGGLAAGIVGAVIGTLGGYEARSRATRANGGKDLPVAIVEDIIAIGGAIAIVAPLAA
jgi:uncharacterized membrane protein